MTAQRPDPVEEWADVSALAARATGYRTASDRGSRRAGVWSFGVMAAALALIVAGLALRPTSGTGSDGPVVASSDDGVFRLELTTPHRTYGPDDVIAPIGSVTYLGPDASVTIVHRTRAVQFRIQEIDGKREMGGGSTDPCIPSELTKGVADVVPFGKAGSPDDPAMGFDRAWYEDPVLRLPVGSWRIMAYLDITVGDCGGVRHQLTISNDIRVGPGNLAPHETIGPIPTSSQPASPASRQPTASSISNDPVVATVDDGMFRLELATPRSTYDPSEAIDPIARVTYLGPEPMTTMYHGGSPVGFTIEEVGGSRSLSSIMTTPCFHTIATTDVPLRYPFVKSGLTEGFDQSWSGDPMLRLPVGTWRIQAHFGVDVTGGTNTCGGIGHRLDVENVITVR